MQTVCYIMQLLKIIMQKNMRTDDGATDAAPAVRSSSTERSQPASQPTSQPALEHLVNLLLNPREEEIGSPHTNKN
jgi:hypothetical protein